MCRLIHCDLDKKRYGNLCLQREEPQPKYYCPSFFVKITVISVQQPITASILKNWIRLRGDSLKNLIEVNIITIYIAKVELYVKSELIGNENPVVYFVAKFIIQPFYVQDTYLSLILSNLHRKILTDNMNNDYVFFGELAFFDEMIDSRGKTYIELQSYRQTSWDKLTLLESKEYWEMGY